MERTVAPNEAAGARIIADALAVYPDGPEAGQILWGREREIVSLEVHDCQTGARTPLRWGAAMAPAFPCKSFAAACRYAIER